MEQKKPKSADDEKLLAAVRRTREEIRLPEGVNVEELVRRSTEAFWQERDALAAQSARKPEPAFGLLGISEYSATLARRAAANLVHPLSEPIKMFAITFGSMATPVTFAVVSIYFIFKLGFEKSWTPTQSQLIQGLPFLMSSLALVCACCIGFISFRDYSKNGRRERLHIWRAALAGGFVLAAFVGFINSNLLAEKNAIATTLDSVSADYAVNCLEKLGVSSLKYRAKNNKFPEIDSKSAACRLRTLEASKDRAVYQAALRYEDRDIISILATLSGDKGTLSVENIKMTDVPPIKKAFLVGTVVDLLGTKLVLQDSSGKKCDIEYLSNAIAYKPSLGSRVVVSYTATGSRKSATMIEGIESTVAVNDHD